MLDLLLKNAVIITMDKEHHLYDKGYIGVKGKKIACIGPMAALVASADAKRVIDMKGHPVLPGLVDGHGHAGHCMTKTLAEHRPDWEDVVSSIYYRYSDEEFWFVEGALAAMERLKFGVTTGVCMVADTPRIDCIEPVGASLEGASLTGIRQLTGIGCANGPWPKVARVYNKDGSYSEREVMPDLAYQTTEEAVRAFHGRHPRQTCIVAPGRMGFRQWESVEANIRHNKEMLRIAREYDLPIHTHAYGKDVQFLHDHTPEALTPHLSLTHSTGYSEDELSILRDTGAYVFHGPTTHANIFKRCPVIEMLERGIHLAVITDGTAPDRSYDIWRDIKNVQLLQRAHFNDDKLLPCGKVLELVTIEPAKALKLDHLIGSLEVGKRADIIAVNTDQPHLAPFGPMPLQRLVYHAMGQDVELVVVDGIIVMEGRTLTQVDEAAMLKRVQASFETMLERLNKPEIMETPRLYELRQ